MIIKSPITWYGGKQKTTKRLLPLIPPHHTYVETHGGAASLLLAKQPSPVEVYNDINYLLYNFFRVLRNEHLFAQFQHKVALSPYSRMEYEECVKAMHDLKIMQNVGIRKDQITATPRIENATVLAEYARMFFIVARQSFGGEFGNSWGSSSTQSRKGMASTVSAYLSAIERLPEVHQRISMVQLECRDFSNIILRYDGPETLFYVDPPYLQESRKGGGHGYDHEMRYDDHVRLIGILKNIQGKFLLSGYPNNLYDEAFNRSIRWNTTCHAAGRTKASGMQGEGSAKEMQERTECIWFNYDIEVDTNDL